MNPLLRLTLVCGLLSLAHGSAMAQMQPPACPRLEKPFLRVPMVDDARTGCPFSAVIQLTTSQTLADGTHIQHNVKALVYRDSLGRIRYESYGPTDTAPSMIEIYDPVEGVSYFFLPQRAAIAYRHKLGQSAANTTVGLQDQHKTAPEPRITGEKLEPQQLEGLLATGTRTARTTPAGAKGNDRPLTEVRETWRSADMGITLLEKTSDPQKGDSERRMTNLEQTEPDPALFHVPADYAIEDQ